MRAELGSVAVQLLSRGDLRAGARRATRLGLTGIFQLGLDGADRGPELAGAVRREVANGLASAERTRQVLLALNEAGIVPVVLKGRALAERLWPQPWMRPCGDLDLLVEGRALAPALSALQRLGLQPCGDDTPGRWRPTVSVVALTSPSCAVDLHLHPFRLVGSGLSAEDLLSRAVATRFLDLPVRVLAPADEILLLLVHAAAHGCVHPKWLLDLHAAARVFPPREWELAADRAAKSRVTRAFWAAARLVPGVPREVARSLRPPASTRPILRQLVAPALRVPWQAPSRLRAYALAWMLEDRPTVRARRLAGMLERQLRARPSAVAASARWIEGACRAGALPPSWLTIRGESMAPTLRNGDRLLVAPYGKGEGPQRGEIVIACRAGRLVAHRVVARGFQVVTRGDACRRDDPPLPAGDVLARVVAIDHRGRFPEGGNA